MTRWWTPANERVRLTAAYNALFLISGGILVTVIYLLVGRGLQASIGTAVTTSARSGEPDVDVTAIPAAPAQPAQTLPPDSPLTPMPVSEQSLIIKITDAALHQLLTNSLLALAVFAVLSTLITWWMAGRVLRPLSVITATARRLSGRNLHDRIHLKAPPGELKQLADTVDDMLDRLERLMTAQQRFAANAAHELRTPLAIQRAAAEIGLADPDPRRVQQIRQKIIEVTEHSQHLVDGLLLLSTTEQGLQHRQPVVLDAAARNAQTVLAAEADQHGITVEADLRPHTVAGDAVMLDHLVRNLLGNAIRHNRPGGHVSLRVDATGLHIRNTGWPVPPGAVPQLFEPFRRLHARQNSPSEGAGLGLSIARSIAHAHGARIHATANPDGGLTIDVIGWPALGSGSPAD